MHLSLCEKPHKQSAEDVLRTIRSIESIYDIYVRYQDGFLIHFYMEMEKHEAYELVDALNREEAMSAESLDKAMALTYDTMPIESFELMLMELKIPFIGLDFKLVNEPFSGVW